MQNDNPFQIVQCILCSQDLHPNADSATECRARGIIHDQHYAHADTLFHQDEPSTYLYTLRQGHIKLTVTQPGGREQIIGIACPGHLIGFHSLYESRHPYTAIAISQVTVCRASHKALAEFFQEHPSALMQALQILNEELSQSHSLICVMGRKSAMEKVSSFLLVLSTMHKTNSEPLPITLSRLEISDALGISEETVSRIMAEMKRSGIIDAPRGKLRILDRKRLQLLADHSHNPTPVHVT